MSLSIAILCALFASQADSGASTEADKLIVRGIEQRRAGDDAAALETFHKAHELSKSARALAQLALAEQALGRWLDAEAHLVAALEAKQDKWIAANAQALQGALESIRSRLGSVTVGCSVGGAEVYMNGRVVGRCPLAQPVRVVAGSVVLEVQAEGFWTFTRQLIVQPGGLVREEAELTPRGAASPPVAPLAPSPRASPAPLPKPRETAPPALTTSLPEADEIPTMTWILGGSAVVAAGAGAALGALAYSAATDRDPSTGAGGPALGANIAFGVGGAALLAVVIVWLAD